MTDDWNVPAPKTYYTLLVLDTESKPHQWVIEYGSYKQIDCHHERINSYNGKPATIIESLDDQQSIDTMVYELNVKFNPQLHMHKCGLCGGNAYNIDQPLCRPCNHDIDIQINNTQHGYTLI